MNLRLISKTYRVAGFNEINLRCWNIFFTTRAIHFKSCFNCLEIYKQLCPLANNHSKNPRLNVDLTSKKTSKIFLNLVLFYAFHSSICFYCLLEQFSFYNFLFYLIIIRTANRRSLKICVLQSFPLYFGVLENLEKEMDNVIRIRHCGILSIVSSVSNLILFSCGISIWIIIQNKFMVI